MDLKILPADQTYITEYTSFLQKIYEEVYTNDQIGLTKECFSKSVFNSKRVQEYLLSNLQNNNHQKAYIALFSKSIVGSITLEDKGTECELRGFYVGSTYQGQGIGKKLWELILPFAKNKDIILDIYSHNRKTIDIYKKWGFEIDKKKGTFFYQWPEWPKGVKAEALYMRYTR